MTINLQVLILITLNIFFNNYVSFNAHKLSRILRQVLHYFLTMFCMYKQTHYECDLAWCPFGQFYLKFLPKDPFREFS